MPPRLPMAAERWHGKLFKVAAPAGESGVTGVALWVAEGGHEYVVHASVKPLTQGPSRLLTSFEEAVRQPAVGTPRVPRRVVVEDRGVADALQKRYGLTAVVKQTDLVDRVFEQLAETLGLESSADPLQSGRVTAEAQLELQRAGGALWTAKPWEYLYDTDLFLVKAPGDPLDGRAISVLGNARDTFGFALYDTLRDAETLLRVAESGFGSPFEHVRYTLVTFDKPPQLSSREQKQPAPAVLGRRRVVVIRLEGSQQPVPHGVELVVAATRIAGGLARLTPQGLGVQHDGLTIEPVGDWAWLSAGEEGAPPAPAPLSRWLAMQPAFLARLIAFFERETAALPTTLPNVILHELLFNSPQPGGGQTCAERFCATHELTADERRWFESQARGRTSVHLVLGVEPGQRVRLRDIFTGATVEVVDRGAARADAVGRLLLARVLVTDGEGWCAASEQRTFDERMAPLIRDVVGTALKLPKVRPIAEERLPTVGLGVSLLEVWASLAAQEDAAARATRLTNSDGDELMPISDTFSVDHPADFRRWMGGAADFNATHDGPEPRWAWVRSGFAGDPGGTTLLAELTLEGSRLVAQTNSVQRADALRDRLKSSGLARFDRREARPVDREALTAQARPRDPDLPPEAVAALQNFKEQHYARWPDVPIPALGNQTPREAARTARGRADLQTVLRSMERGEASQPEAARYDINRVRAVIGLPAE